MATDRSRPCAVGGEEDADNGDDCDDDDDDDDDDADAADAPRAIILTRVDDHVDDVAACLPSPSCILAACLSGPHARPTAQSRSFSSPRDPTGVSEGKPFAQVESTRRFFVWWPASS